ncbi:MAG: LptA/OstA family protein, partial [bacterium]
REGKAVFTGNVVVRDDTGEISARRMEVYYEDDGDTIKYIEAYGNVKIIRDNLFARGQRAEYTVGADTLILEEEAYIKDDQGEFYADWMWIDLASEKLRMQGNIKALLSRESEDENQ